MLNTSGSIADELQSAGLRNDGIGVSSFQACMSVDKKEAISYSFEYDTAPQPVFRPILNLVENVG